LPVREYWLLTSHEQEALPSNGASPEIERKKASRGNKTKAMAKQRNSFTPRRGFFTRRFSLLAGKSTLSRRLIYGLLFNSRGGLNFANSRTSPRPSFEFTTACAPLSGYSFQYLFCSPRCAVGEI